MLRSAATIVNAGLIRGLLAIRGEGALAESGALRDDAATGRKTQETSGFSRSC